MKAMARLVALFNGSSSRRSWAAASTDDSLSRSQGTRAPSGHEDARLSSFHIPFAAPSGRDAVTRRAAAGRGRVAPPASALTAIPAHNVRPSVGLGKALPADMASPVAVDAPSTASASGTTTRLASATRLRAFAALALAVAGLLALSVASAIAAPPALTIAPASSLHFTTAVASGTVDPADHETSYRFDFVTQAQFEAGEWAEASSQGFGSLPEGAGSTPVEATLEGLTPATTYHLRLFAENESGPQEAIAPTFTTPIAPLATTGEATVVLPASATLNATVGAAGGPSASCQFEYVTEAAFAEHGYESAPTKACNPPGPFTGSGENAVTGALTGLAPETTYRFRVASTNANGTVDGADAVFTTPAPVTIAVEPPTAITSSSATLNATVNPNGAATEYRFEYGLHEGYGFTTPLASAGTGTAAVPVSVALTGLHPGATYHYRLVATNSFGTVKTPDQTFATEPVAPTPFLAHELSSSFGPGPGNGSFSAPDGVAVDPTSGDVYVVDRGNARVLKFDAAGAPVDFTAGSGAGTNQLTGAETPATTFSNPAGIAVDPTSGDFYVVDGGNNVVDKFDPAGEYLLQLQTSPSAFVGASFAPGIAVDPADGAIYVDDAGNLTIEKFTPAGAPDPVMPELTGFSNLSQGGVAVDSDHDLYVVDYPAGGVVREFDPAGNPVLTTLAPSEPHALASDASNGDLYVLGANGIEQFDFAGNSLYTFGVPTHYASTNGIAVNPATHTVYAADAATGEIDVFTTFALAQPVPAAGPAIQIGRTGATLQATVNPKGLATTYRFEYGTTAAYGAETPIAPLGGPLDNKVHRASAILSGALQADTTYHFAVVATNSAGTVTGPDQTFTTGPAQPPAATTGAASGVTQSTATLSGFVDPDGLATTYRFELGPTTAYGTPVSGSAGSEPGAQAVTAGFSGLRPGTTYHYRVLATNADGTATGADATFTTPAYPQALAPVHNTGPVRGTTKKPGGGGTKCKKGTVKKHGRCVRKATHKKHHKAAAHHSSKANRIGD